MKALPNFSSLSLHNWAAKALVITLLAATVACGDGKNSQGTKNSTVRSGILHLAADESLKPLIEAEIDSFEHGSPGAKIIAHYVSEAEAFRLFMTDSCTLIAVSRELSDKELKYFKEEKKYTPKTTRFMVDGIVPIAHKERADTSLTRDELKRILTGQVKRWSELGRSIGKDVRSDSISIVFAGSGSSAYRFLQDSLLGGAAVLGRVFAVDSTPAVVDYVAKHPNAIGFVGFAWFSDTDSPEAMALRERVRMLGVVNESGKAVNLSDNALHKLSSSREDLRYPLRRRMYLHNREAFTGLALGFSSYVAAEDGQRIIVKANLIPTSGIIRLMEVQEAPIPETQ